MVELAPIDCPGLSKGNVPVELAPGTFPPGFCQEALALERYRSSEHEPPGPGFKPYRRPRDTDPRTPITAGLSGARSRRGPWGCS